MTSATMRQTGQLAIHFMALLSFVSYLFAGASLSLVAPTACHHCRQAQTEHHAHGESLHHKPVQAGDSCPLSSSGRQCESCHPQTGPNIRLCPGGKLHHEQGEVLTLAKFIVPPAFLAVDKFPVWTEERMLFRLPTTLAFPPRGRPPTLSFLLAS